jgi:hypothetical protein
MSTHHVSLQRPVLQETQSPADEHPDVFVGFNEAVPQEWIDLCLNRYSSRVSNHFQLSAGGFLVRGVPPEQRGSEMANLQEMVHEVNRALAREAEA